MHDESIKQLAELYDIPVEAGKALIVKHWRFFNAAFRDWLVSSHQYSDDGKVLSVASGNDDALVTELEYHLGTIHLCNEVRLPSPRMESSEAFPYFISHARSSAAFLLFHPYGQDPTVLRLALRAVAQQEKARLLESLPTSQEYGIVRFLGRLGLFTISGVLLLASPSFLASVLTSAAAGKFGDTALGCYGLAFTALLVRWVKKLIREEVDSTSSSLERQTLRAWHHLVDDRFESWTGSGAGARALLEDMLRRGLKVPPIAIDLCDALNANAFPVSVPVPNKKLEKAEGVYDRTSPPAVCEPPAKDDAATK